MCLIPEDGSGKKMGKYPFSCVWWLLIIVSQSLPSLVDKIDKKEVLMLLALAISSKTNISMTRHPNTDFGKWAKLRTLQHMCVKYSFTSILT